MNCLKCGMINPDSIRFCCNCGSELTDPNQPVGSIIITRPKRFIGCLIDYDVFIDDYFMGKIANGETKEFIIYYGVHNVVIKQGLNSGNQMIVINDKEQHLVFNCPIKIGLITNHINFEFVKFYNS